MQRSLRAALIFAVLLPFASRADAGWDGTVGRTDKVTTHPTDRPRPLRPSRLACCRSVDST